MRLLLAGYGGGTRANTAGIYDTCEKRFIWESGVPSISFMCADETGRVLFGAGEHDTYGMLYRFADDGGGWRTTDSLHIPGGALCHIAYAPKHHIVTGACYANGDVFAVETSEEGFGAMRYYARQGGDDPESHSVLSRAHCTVFDADEQHMYACNIAQDRVYDYHIVDGTLVECGFAQLAKGVGPRHILSAPANGILYVITEYSNEIITLHKNAQERWEVSACVSMLPEGFTGSSYGSTLCFLPEKAHETHTCQTGYIYAANRGADTIAVFSLDRDGLLIKHGEFSCGGQWPRHIALLGGSCTGGFTQETANPMDDPLMQQHLAVANERSGYVSLFPVNPGNGLLGGEVLRIPFEGASYVSAL